MVWGMPDVSWKEGWPDRSFRGPMHAATRAWLQSLSSLLPPSLPLACTHLWTRHRDSNRNQWACKQAVFVARSGRNLKARFHESWHHLSDSKKESFFCALNSIRVQLSIQMCLYQLQSHAVLLGILVTLPAITNRAV